MEIPSKTKIINIIKTDLDRTYRSPLLLGQPANLSIAVSDVCDIKCPFCPRQFYKDLIINGFFNIEDVRKLTPLFEYANFGELFGTGEPFLHKQFLDIVALCKSYDMKTQTSTHGMTLTEEVCEKVIESKLDNLIISIDAPKRKLFEFLRKGAKFKDVINNVKCLQKLKKKKGAAAPNIGIAVTVSKYNAAYIPAMVKLGRKLGAFLIDFCNLVVVDKQNKDLDVSSSLYYKKRVDKAKRLGAKYGIIITNTLQKPFPWKKLDTETLASYKERHFGCPAAWNMFLIEKTGNVRPCCFTEESYGNALQQDPLSIANGDKAAAFRRRFLEGDLLECCIGCGLLTEVTNDYLKWTFEYLENKIKTANLDDISKKELMELLKKYREI